MPARDRRDHHLTDAELNELVDGTLAANDAERARSHLSTCVDCVERLQALEATVTALQQAPSLMPRRSFQLTPKQAQLPQPTPSWLDRFAQRLVPGLPAIRAATLAVILLLLSVTAIDIITHRNSTSEPVSTVQMSREIGALPTSQDAQAPLIESATESGAAQVEQSAAPEPQVLGEASDSAANGALGDAANQNPPAAPPPAAIPAESEVAPVPAMMAQEATASPMATRGAVASPTPALSTGSGNGVSLSRWRIAELALLLLLLWLIVSWFGRRQMDDEEEAGDAQAGS